MTLADYKYKLPFVTHPHDKVAAGLSGILGDGDAVVLFPYDDGTFYPKRAYFDKRLLGGMGGYETDDEDKIVAAGDGEPVRNLFGIPVVLAIDPTEHSGVVEPIKSLIAEKNNLGEWIRVDKKGNIVEVGEALLNAQDLDTLVDDDNMVKELMEKKQARGETMSYDAAMSKLAQQGDVHKIYDLSPPANAVATDGGEVVIEEATHFAVDQSKAADLLPKKTSSEDLNTALDKARLEEHEEGKLMKYFVYGLIAGGIFAFVMLVGIFFMSSVGGGIFGALVPFLT